MRLQRKHDAQNRGKREQRTTRNKNTVILGGRIAAIRNRRTTWRAHAAHQRRNSREGSRIPCREEQEKPGNGDGCSRHVCRAIAEAAGGEVGFPSEPDTAGRKTKVPIRNAIRHFSRLMHTPAKAKRRLIN